MASLDISLYWEYQDPRTLIENFRRVGCTHYKVHKPLNTFDLPGMARHLRKAVLPGKSAVLMLDNKELDIPTVTIKAVEEHVRMGFDLTTVHATAGPDVLEALVKAGLGRHVVAVTTLTSARDKAMVRVYRAKRATMELRLGRLAFDCGIEGGIVCSAHGIPALKNYVKGVPFMTPGMVWPDEISSDQVAVATPAEATRLGSSILIMGRGLFGTDEKPKKKPWRWFLKAKWHARDAARKMCSGG